ncbi:MAG: hypothetical protein APF82_09720 [Sphingomonadales bacterium BRH_c42]|nr:MAG: hypothetical protein APF82_09720 [Sphingomonadales bacterium BRH_c42]
MLVDVSVIISHDARTGIQRVVRALLGQLVESAGPRFTVQPVFASRDHGYCRAVLTEDGRLDNASGKSDVLQPVAVRRGDVFLGLDLAAHLVPHLEGDLARWRREGVQVCFLVYDLLPLHHPEWFPRPTARKIDRWLEVLRRQADQCICISNVVAGDLSRELSARGSGSLPKITTLPLGSDLTASYPSLGMPIDVGSLRSWMQRHRVVLSVGTVEPRKGHQELLAALEKHWIEVPADDVALLIVGRPGWKTEALQERIRSHPENGKRLLWLGAASDELLLETYAGVAGLVAASHAEGFGLPLIEAFAHGAPVLARDIPVFREIGGPHFDYFDDDAPAAFNARLQAWIRNNKRPPEQVVAALPRWADSAKVLMRELNLVVE